MPRKFSGPLQPGRRTAKVPKRIPRRKSIPVSKVTKLIKNVQLRNCETFRNSGYAQGTDMLHNVTRYYSGLLNTKQGIQNPDGGNTIDSTIPGGRTGAEIVAKGLSFKFHLERESAAAGSHFRVVVFKYKSGQSVNDSLFWQGASGNGANNMLRILDTIDTSEVKVLKHILVKPPIQGYFHSHLEFYVPLKNLKVRYPTGQSDGQSPSEPEHWNIGFAVVGDYKHSTAITSKIAELNYAWKLFYKDP